jgi:hypothetical protein
MGLIPFAQLLLDTLWPTHIDGTTSYSWQVVATCDYSILGVPVAQTMRIKNGATNDASVSVPGNTLVPTMFTAAISGPSISADSNCPLRIEGHGCKVYSSKIVVSQTNASKTQLYIPLTSIDSAAATPYVSTNSATFHQPNAFNFPTYNWKNLEPLQGRTDRSSREYRAH